MLVGLGACIVASFCLGTIFVPVKMCAPSDGFMVQFLMAVGGFLVSFAVNAILQFPPIAPLAMIGGALWCTANAFALMIMNRLGMALGILIWSSVSCLTGWATSRYGLFGIPQVVPNSSLLNYAGVIILIIGSLFYLFIKSTIHRHPSEIKMESKTKSELEVGTIEEPMELGHHHISLPVRLISVAGAIFSGLFYGSMCTPVTYLQNHTDEFPLASKMGLPYLFSFFCGILPTATAILVIYSLIKKNSPSIPPTLVLPALMAGVLFAFGIAGFFIGNERLSQTIAYPICSFLPGVIVSLWSVFYFKEITGKRNLYLLLTAYGCTLLGVLLVTISKDI
ncbi:unnamed protein product [Caenorhabditis bovis]|uniref:Transmembrane protein 144 n=1 Tax=Caenorhabditis bovis TaxID=2654633 RepID=A0A8S1F4Y8_9PELO|nr:unnamed protein product [Caenorhabditis bovis]